MLSNNKPNSLQNILRDKEKLITGMDFGVIKKADTFTLYGIYLDLTIEGLQNIGLIVNRVTTYFEKIKQEGLQLELYNEYKNLAE